MPTNLTSFPTSLPAGLWPPDLSDPLIRQIVLAAGGLVLVVILWRLLGVLRTSRLAAQIRADVQRRRAEGQHQHEEAARLAERVVATSSTSRVAGYLIHRQIETVCTDGQPSSAAALELLKALAAEKGANGLINVQTQAAPYGKWLARGDAVVLQLIGRRGGGPPGR